MFVTGLYFLFFPHEELHCYGIKLSFVISHTDELQINKNSWGTGVGPAHGLLESAIRLKVWAILGAWQTVWSNFSSFLAFWTPPSRTARFVIQLKTFFLVDFFELSKEWAPVVMKKKQDFYRALLYRRYTLVYACNMFTYSRRKAFLWLLAL